MADEWRIREIFNQTLLFFALGVREKVVGSGPNGNANPSPLPPFRGQPVEQKLLAVMDEVAQNPRDLKLVDTTLARIANSKPKTDKTPPWRIGEVVDWWLTASVALARWKKSMMMRQDGGDRSGTGERRMEAVAFEERLWHATIRRLQLDDDEEYPPVWCLDHLDSWRLDHPVPADGRPAWWDRAASGPDECRLALLEWCGDPGRELAALVQSGASPSVDAWAADYEGRHRDFARSALRLLRRRCRFAPPHAPNSDANYRWRIARTAQSPTARRILLRPMTTIDAVDADANRLPGWYVSPWPATVVEQCRKVAESGQRHGSIDRAIAAAAAAFPPEDRTFAPLAPWGLAEAAGVEVERLVVGVERLAAAARLAVIEDVGLRAAPADGQAAPPAARPTGMLRDALVAEGFNWRRMAADPAVGRRLPFGAGEGVPRGEPASRLILERVGSAASVDVGVVGTPARCPDELLAAIEAFDWPWWSVGAVRDAGDARGVVGQLTGFAAAAEWEPLKRRLLDLDPGTRDAAEGLAAAFTTLDTRLGAGLAACAVSGEAMSLRALLLDRIGDVRNAVLRQLMAIDREGQGGLYPRRTAEGRIDLAACATDRCRRDARAGEWDFAWRKSKARFGAQISEPRCEGGRFRVECSAGESVTEADLRLLAAMRLADAPGSPWDTLWLPLRTRVAAGLDQGQSPDFAAAIGEMRESWNGVAAPAFDDLVKMAVAGQPRAVATVRLFQADSRFAFVCHPAIDVGEQGVSLRQAAVGDPLGWRDDQAVPANADVEIVYGVDPARARRVVSRGQPAAASPEACAARFEAVVPAGSPARAAAERLRLAIDRRRMFGAAAPDPLSAVAAAVDALNPSVSSEAWWPAAFNALAECCRACKGVIVPAGWTPVEGVPPDGLEITRIGFHGSVPLGRAVVERFGVTADDGKVVAAPEFSRSAGPEPAGYQALVETAAALAGETDAVAKFCRTVQDFPRRVENGHSANTIAHDLFKFAWDAKLAHDDPATEAAVQAVHQLLERCYGMVVFVPKSVGDFPKNWLETREGSQPRASRVEVVRPGVRTRDNKLVCSAIVESE